MGEARQHSTPAWPAGPHSSRPGVPAQPGASIQEVSWSRSPALIGWSVQISLHGNCLPLPWQPAGRWVPGSLLPTRRSPLWKEEAICLTRFPEAPLPRSQGLQPSPWEPRRCRRASALCQAPGDRWTLSLPELVRGAVRAPVVGGCPPFCLLLAPPQSPQSQGLRRAQTTTPRPPRCIPHPPRSLDIRPPSPGGAPAPLPPVRSSCPLTGSSAGCLPSGHHHQLSRNQKPHKQKITKPSAEINDIENKAIEKINKNKNPIL